MDTSTVKDELRTLVREAGIRMIDSGLTVSTWGNVSVMDRAEGLLYITPSGMDYHALKNADIDVFSLESGELIDGFRKPSIELGMHRAIHLARPDITVCVHTHPIFSTVFSSMGEGIPINAHDEAAQALGDDVRCALYALPGTSELAAAAVAALGERANACLLRSHGAVAVGSSVDGAFKVATVLEMVAEILWRIRAVGGSYLPISDGNVAAMQEFVRTSYGQSSAE